MGGNNNTYEVFMPCFNCYYAYSCKYYRSELWTWWILANKVCPAFTYPFDSLHQAIINRNKELQLEKERNSHNKWMSTEEWLSSQS